MVTVASKSPRVGYIIGRAWLSLARHWFTTCLAVTVINGVGFIFNYHMYSSLLEIDIRPGHGFGIFELGMFNVHI